MGLNHISSIPNIKSYYSRGPIALYFFFLVSTKAMTIARATMPRLHIIGISCVQCSIIQLIICMSDLPICIPDIKVCLVSSSILIIC